MTRSAGTHGPPQTAEEHSEEAIFKGVAKHTLIYGLGMLISRAVSFLMLPIYLNYLTPADYGVMFLVEMTLDFISIIAGGQLALGVFRFYHKTDDPVERRHMVSTSFILVGILYAIVGAGTFLAAEPLSRLIFGDAEQTLVLRIAAVNLAMTALVVVPMSLARVEDLSKLYVGVNLVKLVLMVGFNVLFLIVMGMGVLGIFLTSVIANSMVGAGLGIWIVRRIGFVFSLHWTKELLRYGVPLIGMQVATFLATFGDRYFLQAAANEEVVGLYGLAYTFGFIMVVVGFTPIEMVWSPKRFEVARRENRDEMLSGGFLLHSIALLTVGVGITLYVEDVLRVMADPEFIAAATVVPVILVAYVFQAWAVVQDIGILVEERTRYLTWINLVAAAVALAGYSLLIPRYLEWGAAYATLLSFVTRYALTYYVSQRLWPVRYRWRPVLVLTGWAVAVCALSLGLPEMNAFVGLAVRTGLVAVYGVGVWLLPILRPQERKAALRVGRAVVRRLRRRPA